MSLGAWIEAAIAEAHLPILAAFLIGVLASVGPCPLATNLTALSYTARQFGDRRAVLATGVLYTAGRAIAYGVLGFLLAVAGVEVGRLARGLQDVGSAVLGPLLILAGLVLLDVIHLNLGAGGGFLAGLQERVLSGTGLAGKALGAFLLGLVLALAFCPYSAALFFGALMPLALGSAGGVGLPLVFGLGAGMPVLALGVPLALGLKGIASAVKRLEQVEAVVRDITGAFFLGAGVYSLFTFVQGLLA